MMGIMYLRPSLLVVALGSSACGLATDFHGGEEQPATSASSTTAASSTTGGASTSSADAASTAQSGGQTTSTGGGGSPGVGGGGDVGSSSAAAAGGAADGDGGGGGSLPFCGDGAINELEECDDGDGDEGDGCDELCRLECVAGEVARVSTRTCLALTLGDVARSWTQARAVCEEAGGDLVVLHELELPSFEGRLEVAHVGALRVDGEFAWVDGRDVEASIEEQDAGDCMAARLDGEVTTHLVAVACSLPLDFVCERDPSSQ